MHAAECRAESDATNGHKDATNGHKSESCLLKPPDIGTIPVHATILSDSNLNISQIVTGSVAFWTDSKC